jgi:hypothetical protein
MMKRALIVVLLVVTGATGLFFGLVLWFFLHGA